MMRLFVRSVVEVCDYISALASHTHLLPCQQMKNKYEEEKK